MAKEIKQLAIVNPPANTNVVGYYQAVPGIYLLSILATNKDIVDERISIWVYNSASVQNTGYIAASELITGRSSYYSQKFSLQQNDQIHIRSTGASTSFVISGVNQTET
jgi:hypothetical protein